RIPGIVPLGAASPSPQLFPTRRMRRVLSGVFQRLGDEVNVYDVAPGREEFRKLIAQRAIEKGARLRPDDIIATCGCLEALHLSLRAVSKPGDMVAVENPTYFGILQVLETLGLRAVEIPTDPRTGMDLDAFRKALRTRKLAAAVVMPNFHNPLGSKMPDAHKKELVSLAATRNLPLIEDDIYGDLYYTGPRPRTLKSYDTEGLVILCSSFSKLLSPGLRVGWCAPGRYRNEVERLKMMSTIGTGTIPQLLITEMLRGGGYDRFLRGLRNSFYTQTQKTIAAIGKYFPEGTRVTKPQGGFVLWVELPRGIDSVELARKALQKNISVAPGILFSPKGSFRNFLRISCGQIWTETIDRALLTLGLLSRGIA
ncbi:MAG TPA: PLP-dependent aminotransferase family protein, partial [Acidobacteriota bacterium]|nr:PLP-dependent aminotransferase family protein [Acidobacteriota bacterium]